MYCKKCGTELPDNAKHCMKCGAEIAGSIHISASRNLFKPQKNSCEINVSERKKSVFKEPKTWLVILLLILGFPPVVAYFTIDFMRFIPILGRVLVMFVPPIAALVILWRKQSWKRKVRTAITVGYIILMFMSLFMQ